MSTLPNSAIAAASVDAIDASSPTSVTTRSVRRPAASTSAAASSTTSVLRDVGTTSAPACREPLRERAADAGGAADDDSGAARQIERSKRHQVRISPGSRRFDGGHVGARRRDQRVAPSAANRLQIAQVAAHADGAGAGGEELADGAERDAAGRHERICGSGALSALM